jgi:glycosyltransferase involved in cell wall biosynthesis
MIIKPSNWSIEDFERSLHPEYSAIRDLVSKYPHDRFTLVGLGSRFSRIAHPTRGGLVFYNLGSRRLSFLFSYALLGMLMFAVRPRIVIAMGLWVQVPAQLVCDLIGCKQIAVAIGEPFYTKNRFANSVARFFFRIALLRVAAVLAISKKMKADVLEIIGRPRKIDVYSYTLAPVFKPHPIKPHNRPVILTSCRIHRRKGLELIVNAARLVLRQRPDAVFIIRGPKSDHAYAEEIRRLISASGLSKSVSLVEETRKYDELASIMSKADIFVHTSLAESFGLSVAEASASGIPVVATNVGGIPEIINNGVNGLLIDPKAESVAFAITRILQDDSLRRRLRKGAALYSRAAHIKRPNEFGEMINNTIVQLGGALRGKRT